MEHPLAIEVAAQLTFFDESLREENVFRLLVVIEDVNAQLAQIHLFEREADERADGVGAKAAIPRRRFADEEPEPSAARNPIDVMDRSIADVGAIVATFDGEVALRTRGVHGALDPFDLALKRDRITRLQRADDVRIVHPPITALRILALERAQDDVFACDHESPSSLS